MITAPKTHLEQYVSIFAGCLQYMAGDACGWGEVETGGPVLGLFSHAGRPVVMLAGPGGPETCNETTHFAMDTDYVTALNRNLQEKFGIQYMGNWHSHHVLGIDHPSGGDADNIHRLARRHNIPRMVQIILTHEQGSNWGTDIKCARIRANAFIYEEASNGPFMRCQIRVLQSQSPIRTALANSDVLCIPGRPSFEDLPLSRIIYDGREPYTESVDVEQKIPPVLVAQLAELPDEIARQAELHIYEDRILLSLPLLDSCRVGVMYATEESSAKVHSVSVVRPQEKTPVDITKDILISDDHPSLSLIHKRAQDKINSTKATDYYCGCHYFASKLCDSKDIKENKGLRDEVNH